MDTKWKNIKKALSFLIFFLGVSLTLWNISGLLRRMSDGMLLRISGTLLEDDYQQSWEFQNYMTSRLEGFLSIAVNGYPAGWEYYSGCDPYDYGQGTTYSYDTDSCAILEEQIHSFETALAEGGDYWEDPGYWKDHGIYDYEDYEEYLEEYEEYLEDYERYAEALQRGMGDYVYTGDYAGYMEEMYGSYGWFRPDARAELTEEQKELRAQQMERMTRMYFAGFEEDKNLLYSISRDGQLLYSNSDLLVADGSMQVPEGYNFLLYFDGEKVRITKDGEEVDIYGDGYYRDDKSDWYVPGYRNFPVSDDMKNVVICMAAAKEPVFYTTGIDKNGGYRQQNNSLYWMQYNSAMRWKHLRWNLIGLAVGLALLFFSCFCRKGRLEVLEKLAGFQGKIWVECKVLILIFLLAAGMNQYFTDGCYAYNIWWEFTNAYDVWSTTELIGEYGGAILSSLWYMPLFWIVVFWGIYLTVNDFRYNKKIWKQGLIAKCCNAYSSRELKLPFARRMIRRNVILIAAIAFSGVLMLTGAVCFVNEYRLWGYCDIWVVFLWCILITACLLVAAYLTGSKNIKAARDVETLSERINDICSGNYNGSDETIYSYDRWSVKRKDTTGTGGMTAGAGEEAFSAGNGSPEGTESGDPTDKDMEMGSVAAGSSGAEGCSGTSGIPYAGHDLGDTLAQLENIRQGMASAVDEQMKSERMKVELIANVSHDIKTPLTSIISYVQFLKDEEGLPEHVQDYVKILDEKSQRLKNMVQDVFAVSKAASGELPMNMEKLDFGKLLRQTMADMDEEIQNSSVTFRTELPEKPVLIMADGQRMYRVFQNLFQNALKYSLDGSRVYVTLKTDGKLAVASVKNTSHMELDEDKNFTERFVRGDKSRTDGGSGLGLSIAQSFTEACGGQFGMEFNADLFIVNISFGVIEE